MLFYECSMSYKIKKESRLEVLAEQPKKICGDAIFQDMNDTLAENSADKIEILICSAKVGKFKLVVGVDSLKKKYCRRFFCRICRKIFCSMEMEFVENFWRRKYGKYQKSFRQN